MNNMSDFVLIRINDTGVIPIINEENPEYAMVTPRILKALKKAGVSVDMVTEDEFDKTVTIPEFKLEKQEVLKGQPATSRPTSRRRPAVALVDVVVKGERIIEVVEKQVEDVEPKVEVEPEEKTEDDIAKDLISSIKSKKDVDKLTKANCKLILDYLGERCVYRDNLSTRRANVKKALF
jgi:hypothetical protein